MVIKHPTTFDNPFASLEKSGEFSRVNLVVPKESLDYIVQIRSRPRGVIVTTFNILFIKLLNALHERNITSHEQQQQFLDFIIRSKLVDGSTVEGTGTIERPIPDRTDLGVMLTSQTPTHPKGVTEGHSVTSGNEVQPQSLQPSGRRVSRRSK